MTTEETKADKTSLIRILRNRPFFLLWIGELVSQSGDYLFEVALLWLVLKETGSILNVGLVVTASLLPPVLIGPIAGVYIDRFNRRTIMIAGNLFQAAIVSIIAILYAVHLLGFAVLLLLVFLLMTGSQFVKPAVSALIPSIVRQNDLMGANGLATMSQSMNQLAGFAIGGVAVLLVGPTLPIYYDGISFVFAATMVSLIAKALCKVPVSLSTSNSTTRDTFLSGFKEGLDFIRRSRILVELAIFALVINFFGGGITALIAPYAAYAVHGDSSTYGFILSSFALGTILGALLVGKINSRRYLGKLVFAGVFASGVMMSALGAVSIAAIAIALSAVLGLILSMVNLPLSTLVQVRVPGSLLGRVGTSLGALTALAQPIAASLSGEIANRISVGVTFEIFGACVVVLTVVTMAIFKDLRNASY